MHVNVHVMCLLQDGQTALYIASRKGHIAVVKLLLGLSADVSISKKVLYMYGAHTDPSLILEHTHVELYTKQTCFKSYYSN